MHTVHGLLKGIEWVLTRTVAVSVLFAMLFSSYALWDNQQVYETAKNVQDDLLRLKPLDNGGNLAPGFEELRGVNPDICAWLTVEDTGIDYPVVQGSNNLAYLNKDIYGELSMAGSIYLDSRNNRDFTDRYNLIYGHHMDQHRMFGDVELFKEEEFFRTHTDAQLLLPEEVCEFKVLAVMDVLESERRIFTPGRWTEGLTDLGVYLQENALHVSESELEALFASPDQQQILALVTCSSGATGTKTVLFLQRPKSWVIIQPDDPDIPDNPMQPTEPDDPIQPTEPDNPVVPDSPDAPATGEPAILYGLLMLAALVVGIRMAWKIRKKDMIL